MNRLERYGELDMLLQAALTAWQAGIYTALPARIESFDKDKLTCEATALIQAQVTNKDGSKQWVTLPKLVDVPVVFPGGGGYTLTFPVAQGDEALIVFASRCIDAWWQLGAASGTDPGRPQLDLRMHDLSDGFALVGVRSLPRPLTGGVKLTSTQLRSDDGTTFVEVANGHVVNVTAPGGINLSTTGSITMTAAGGINANNVTIASDGTTQSPVSFKAPSVWGSTDVKFGPSGKSTLGHTHSGVTTGTGNTGGPN